MGTWIGLFALAGVAGVAYYGHKQINRLDNTVDSMDNGIRQMPGATLYLQTRFPGSFR